MWFATIELLLFLIIWMGKDCPIFTLLGMLGKKWVIMILKSIHDGKHTFTEIKDDITEISANLLTERLNELIAAGYVTKEVLSVQPVKIHYGLSMKGKELSQLLKPLVVFAGGCK